MTSTIDPTKPDDAVLYTGELRANLLAAKTEIEELQGSLTYRIKGDAEYFTAAATFTIGSDIITISGANFNVGRVGQYIGVRQTGGDIWPHTDAIPAFRRTVTEVLSGTQLRMDSPAPYTNSGVDAIVGPDITSELNTEVLTNRFTRIEFSGGVLHEHITFDGIAFPHLTLGSGVELVGLEGATIYRIPLYGAGFTEGRMFNCINGARVTFRNLRIHGTRWFQCVDGISEPWPRSHEMQHKHCINVEGDSTHITSTHILNCILEETSGEGLAATANSNTYVHDTLFRNCFRGGITTLTATANLFARNLRSEDDLSTPGASTSGITNEVIGGGMDEPQIIEIDGWDMGEGSLQGTTTGDIGGEDLPMSYTSNMMYRNIRQPRTSKAIRGSFRTSGNSRLDIINSTLISGPNDFYSINMLGSNISCTGVQFVASMKGLSGIQLDPPGAASCLRLETGGDVNMGRAKMTFTDCEFIIAADVPDEIEVAAILINEISNMSSSRVVQTRWPQVGVEFVNCHFAGRSGHRDFPGETRVFDRIMKTFGTDRMGGHVAFINCAGEAKVGFELRNDTAGYVTLGGHTFTTHERLMKLTNVEGVTRKLILNWNGLVMDSANAGIEYDNAACYPMYGTPRVIMVPNDPSIQTNTVTNLLMQSLRHKRAIWGFRLPPGQAIVPGSVIMNSPFGGGFTYTDQGDGTLLGAHAAPNTGTIDYATGVLYLDYTGSTNYFEASYSYNQGVCGLRGDTAQLYTDPLAKWVCTVPASFGLPATWVAL